MSNTILKDCKKHGETIFKYSSGNKSYCVECKNIQSTHQRYAQKIKAILFLGGKCIECNNYFNDISVYDFHHLFQKDFSISALITKNKKFESFIDELDKCQLLCANCHCENHDKDELILSENKSYNSNYVSNKRLEIKLKSIEYLGGKCIECNYDKSIRALNPHHLFDKSFAIGGNGTIRKWENIQKELDKCELLCTNCHRPKHSHFKNYDFEVLTHYLKQPIPYWLLK